MRRYAFRVSIPAAPISGCLSASGPNPMIVFRNALALLGGAILLIVGFMFSIVLLAVVAVLGLSAWGYFYWKTRKLRRAMKEHTPESLIIEGEAIVVEEYRAAAKEVLSSDPPQT